MAKRRKRETKAQKAQKAEVVTAKDRLRRIWERTRYIKDRAMLLEILKDAQHPREVEVLILSMRPDLAPKKLIITDNGTIQ